MDQQNQRDWKIDALRAITLLGIVLVHFIEEFYAGSWPESIEKNLHPNIADQIVKGFVNIFIWGKFYLIFSFLFGLSFNFIVKTFDRSNVKKFIIRLIILFAIGWIHHLHYRGDILTIYAILGLLLPVFYHLDSRKLLITGLFFATNMPSLIIRLSELILNTSVAQGFFETTDAVHQKYYDTISMGSYYDILIANSKEFWGKMLFQLGSGRIFITFGLFLLGLWTGKNNNPLQEVFDKSLLKRAGWLVLICLVIMITAGLIINALNLGNDNPVLWLILGIPFDIYNLALAVVYVCIFYMLASGQKAQYWLKQLSFTGRMSLTTYVMQTLIGTFIFFGWGLGYISKFGAATLFILGIFVFGFQIWFSKFWLSKFNYGPLEKVWRVSTDFFNKRI